MKQLIKRISQSRSTIPISFSLIGISLALATLSTVQATRAITWDDLGERIRDSINRGTIAPDPMVNPSSKEYQNYIQSLETEQTKYEKDLKAVQSLRFPQSVNSIVNRISMGEYWTNEDATYFQREYSGGKVIGFWMKNGRVYNYVYR